MIYSVQTLLAPTGHKNLADVAIDLPEELSDALKKIFSFDVGGCAELEGDNIFQAFLNLGEAVVGNEVCKIRFWEEDLGQGEMIYALAPIKKAEDVICFIEDQISEIPRQKTVNSVGMRDVLLGGTERADDVVGWFDLNTPSFIFKDHMSFVKLQHLFGCLHSSIPTINRVMDFYPTVGSTPSQALPLMLRLADIWKREVSCEWNEKILRVKPGSSLEL